MRNLWLPKRGCSDATTDRIQAHAEAFASLRVRRSRLGRWSGAVARSRHFSIGALVEAEAAPAAGTILRLKCGATTVDGRVAWSERGWFGVEFETPLLASEVVDPAGAKLAVSAPRSYRAGDVLE